MVEKRGRHVRWTLFIDGKQRGAIHNLLIALISIAGPLHIVEGDSLSKMVQSSSCKS